MKRIVLILCLILAALLASCQPAATTATGSTAPTTSSTAPTTDTIAQATLARYRENEVREYKGARLDPAIGPRDNSIKGIQNVDIAGYRLTIDGLAARPTVMTYDEVKALGAIERKITLYCVEGWDATILWRGVQLSTLIALVEAKPEVNTVIFHCVDGYTTSLPLATIIENQLILAYESNGLPLPPAMGYPFIVVAEDKLGYKWARWVERIELSANADYRGYWESNGYSNEANID